MERVSLEAELSAAETALESPLRGEFGDDLGARGRFAVNHQQNRDIKQSIAAVAVKLDRFIEASEAWRTMHRNVLLIIGVAVLITFGIVIAIVTYLFTTGAL